MFRSSTNIEWSPISDLRELKNKEGYELKFIHKSEELKDYVEIFIITEAKKLIKVICADDPYHDVEMDLDTGNYQSKIDSGDILAATSKDKTFLGIEILESLESIEGIQED